MKKLTLIGPMLAGRRAESPGGRATAFMDLLRYLDATGVPYRAVDSTRFNHIPKLGRPLSALWTMAHAKESAAEGHVSFHGGGPGIARIGGRLIASAEKSGATVSFRLYGGRINSYFEAASAAERRQIQNVFRKAAGLFLETKYQVDFFQRITPHVYWFPNSRSAVSGFQLKHRPYARRFVFLGQLREDKGILEFIETARRLGPSYTFDAYGPVVDTVNEASFAGSPANYKGVLSPSQVPGTLATYDALVLPTDYPGEGYPGVIIEALSVGVPSIASTRGGIPEIIVDGECGFIIEPRDVESILNAIVRFENLEVNALRDQALERFALFDADEQCRVYLERCGVLP